MEKVTMFQTSDGKLFDLKNKEAAEFHELNTAMATDLVKLLESLDLSGQRNMAALGRWIIMNYKDLLNLLQTFDQKRADHFKKYPQSGEPNNG